jgi:hypothetical protein
MATRGRTTFQKRQKEMARKERQQRKAERREHRKMSRSVEDRTPPQDPAFPSVPDSESADFDASEQQSDGWRPAHRGHSNLQ